MLTKNCRIILKTLNKHKDEYFTLRHLEALCKLSGPELSRAVDHLIALDFVRYTKFSELPGKGPVRFSDPPIELTELGANYRRARLMEILKYIADKWTDITACVIAIISLIVSIWTALSNSQ